MKRTVLLLSISLFATIILGWVNLAEAQEAIFLVRHAEAAGPINPPLTEAGQRRAKALAVVLEDADIDVIFVSK